MSDFCVTTLSDQAAAQLIKLNLVSKVDRVLVIARSRRDRNPQA